MFPDQTYQEIVKDIDEVEAEVFRLYRKLERMRLTLQKRWRVLPNGERWTEAKHAATEHSAK